MRIEFVTSARDEKGLTYLGTMTLVEFERFFIAWAILGRRPNRLPS